MYLKQRQRAKDFLGFNDWWFIAIAVPLISVLMPVLFYSMNFRSGLHCFLYGPLEIMTFTLLFWLGNRQLTIYYRRKFPDVSELKKRLIRQYISIALFTLTMAFVMHKLDQQVQLFAAGGEEPDFWKKFLACLFVTAFISTIYETVFFINLWKRGIAANSELQRAHMESQLESLKNQVNPHFLFNSLNTLAGIIPEDPGSAVVFVQKLSLVYRCILELRHRTVVPLQEELECLDNYLYLLNTRFGDNLVVEIFISKESRQKFVVPMALQMLVENAVKHNVASNRRPLRILITDLPEALVVSNPLQPKTSEENGTGMGLSNIDDRYKLVSGKRIRVEQTEEKFEVHIPLLTVENYEGSDRRR